jgi:hypothetical protein
LKKEITLAALSAVALIVFLSRASYLLFPETPVSVPPTPPSAPSIDVYTQKGGQGKDQPGGAFSLSQNETVRLYAEVRDASNKPLGSRLVAFEIHWPDGPHSGSIYDIGSVPTDSSTGIATIRPIQTFDTRPDFKGTWLVYVTTPVDDKTVVDTLTFLVQ